MDPLELDDHQRRAVRWATLAVGGLIAHQVAGKATRDSLFLSSFDVERLPPMMMAAAALAALSVLGMSRLLGRGAPARVVPTLIGTGALLLTAEWALSLTAPEVAAVVVYLHMAVFGNTLVSGFWSVVNERFDPYTARRVMGRIGTGAGVGGVVGGALAWGVTRAIPVPATLLVMAGLTVLSLASLVAMARAPGPAARPASRDTVSGLRLVRETPYLTSLALVVGLGAASEAMLDYALGAQAKQSFASHPESLMSFFALYHTGVGLFGLVVQGLLTRPVLGTLGLAGTVALKPVFFTLGGVLGALAPRLWTAAVARGVPAVLHNSLFRSGYELLYTPLSEQVKRPTKALLDVGADKAGAMLGSAVALVLVAAAPDLTARLLFALAGLLGIAVLGVCRGLHRGYVGALEQSLRSGVVEIDSSEVMDSTTRLTLAATNLSLERDTLLAQVRALRSESGSTDGGSSSSDARAQIVDPVARAVADLRAGAPRSVRRVLSGELTPELVPHVVPLLGRNELFLDALRGLRRVAPRSTGALLDALLDPGQPAAVRRRLPRVLRACPTQRAVDGLMLALRDDRFDVRFECGVALVRLVSEGSGLRIRSEAIWERVSEELALPVEPASAAGQQRLEHVFNLLSLVLEREPLRIAYWALQSEEAVRGTALEYLENVLPERVRKSLWPMMGVRLSSPSRPRPARPPRDLAEELLRSQTSVLMRDRIRRELEGSDEDG